MPKPGKRACPACGGPAGTSADCLSCRDAAAKELARAARDITPETVAARAEAARRFAERPPWWAKGAPGGLRSKVGLLWLVLRDWLNGSYRKIPWKAIAALAAAVLYVVSPIDLVPDLLGPPGWADDLLALALTWGLLKRELVEYCAWKGLSPAHFGLVREGGGGSGR